LLKQAQLMQQDLAIDAVIAGCTEIPLVFTQDRVPTLKVLNPTQILADQVVHETLVARVLPN
jgi:aspartate/glutamate racemase